LLNHENFKIPFITNIKKFSFCNQFFSTCKTTSRGVAHNKKAPEGADFKNGAGNVVVLETISHLLKVVKSEEYQWVEFNLQKLIA